jgi:hypothetical protein
MVMPYSIRYPVSRLVGGELAMYQGAFIPCRSNLSQDPSDPAPLAIVSWLQEAYDLIERIVKLLVKQDAARAALRRRKRK